MWWDENSFSVSLTQWLPRQLAMSSRKEDTGKTVLCQNGAL